MKKFICLLLCAVLLCACGAPAVPETPAAPETPTVQETPAAPTQPEQPAAPEAPTVPEAPATPAQPVTPGTPVAPETPVEGPDPSPEGAGALWTDGQITEYGSLPDMVAIASEKGGTVKMLKDYEHTDNKVGFALSSASSFTFDLNGCTLSSVTRGLNVSGEGVVGITTVTDTKGGGMIKSQQLNINISAGGIIVNGGNYWCETQQNLCYYETSDAWNDVNLVENIVAVNPIWAGFAYNLTDGRPMEKAKVTFRNCTLANFNPSGNLAITVQSKAQSAQTVLGEGVKLYTYSSTESPTSSRLQVSGKPLTHVKRLHTIKLDWLDGREYRDLCLWTTDPVQSEAPKPLPAGVDFLVGYGKADISPTMPVPLRGYGNEAQRMSIEVLDPICATAVAVTGQNGKSVLLVGIDLCRTDTYLAEMQTAAVRGVSGELTADEIFINGTHSHSAPDLATLSATPYLEEYRKEVAAGIEEAARTAWENREKATMYTSQAETENLTFLRHYRCEDGSYFGAAWGGRVKSAPLKSHLDGIDNTVRLVRFDRETGKDVLMMNFQVHPSLASYGKALQQKRDATADVVGSIRTLLEQELNCDFLFLQGAAGDTLPTDEVTPSNTKPSLEAYAQAMYESVQKALANETRQKGGDVKVNTYKSVMNTNHADKHRAEDAQKVVDYNSQYGTTAAHEYARSLGFYQYHHASTALSNSKKPATQEVPVSVFSIGDVGFAANPFEMFSQTGMQIRNGSPYSMTFVLAYTNGHWTYLPTKRAFEDYFSYEACLCKFEPGAAETLGAELAQKLTELKKQ